MFFKNGTYTTSDPNEIECLDSLAYNPKINKMKNQYPLKDLVGTKKDLHEHIYTWADNLNMLDTAKEYLEKDAKFHSFYNSLKVTDTIVTYKYGYPFASREGYYALRAGKIIGKYNVIMS